MAKVVLASLVKIFPEKGGPGVRAVNDVSLTVEDREFMVLVGPSGCGKSTTLRMIAGLEEIDQGTVTIDGRVVNAVLPKDRDIAMVFQNYALYPHMSVYDNLAFGLKMRKIPPAEIVARVREASALLGLESLLGRLPKALSGGQRQRVAVGRAIVRKPKVFLFDEPLSNLDAKMRVQMRAEISKLHARLGATLIYVTHDQVEAMTLGDRIVVMHEGRVRQVDTPANVYDRPHDTFVAGFLGSPPMNLLDGMLVQRDGRWYAQLADAPALQLALPPALATAAARAGARAVIVGIRPEHLTALPLNGAPPADRLTASVELAEPLGHEQLLHLRAGGVSLTARGAPGDRPPVGSLVAVHMAPERLHLFDAATGVSLTA
jgi:multiple sugar transport system ATP-binding protein